MRKVILLLSLILVMLSSVVAGTLAMYTVNLENAAEGSVVAKEFVFVGEGTDSFRHGIRIAPAETVQWRFTVKNYKNQIVTETDLYYKLAFDVTALPGKSAIEPLKVTIKDTDGNVLKSITGVGQFDVLGSFPLAAAGQEKDYVVELYWPSGANDIQYAGSNYGTAVNVDAIASQVPLTATEPQPQGQVLVKYETTVPWQNGQSGDFQYAYQITLTNNSDRPIQNWDLSFSLYNDRITGAWSNARMTSYTPPGHYMFMNPAYNNTATDSILPGQSVKFGGQAYGMGAEPLQDITVGGSNVPAITDIVLSLEYNKPSLN